MACGYCEHSKYDHQNGGGRCKVGKCDCGRYQEPPQQALAEPARSDRWDEPEPVVVSAALKLPPEPLPPGRVVAARPARPAKASEGPRGNRFVSKGLGRGCPRVMVRFSPAQLAALDARRGELSRAEYLRRQAEVG